VSYSLLVRPEAQADLAETQKWYEERATGLGRQFVEAVDDTLVSITNNPLAYPTVRNVVRRALTKRFPYGVLFLVEADTAVVLAILHQARDPELWSRRA
jgi:plasmid stabilization system protein ParE